MPKVHIDVRQIVGLEDLYVGDKGVVDLNPYRPYVVDDGDDDYLVSSEKLTVTLVDGVADVELPQTPDENLMKVQLRNVKGYGEPFYVVIPAGDCNLFELEHIDKDTLDPEIPPSPAWVAQLAAEAEAREDADTALQAAIDAVEASDVDSVAGLSGTVTAAGLKTAINLPADTVTSLAAKADLVGGKVPAAQIPDLAITSVQVVASQAAMLALTAEQGDVAIRTDFTPNRAYILASNSPSTLADWKDITATDLVQSVAGLNGNISAADLMTAIDTLLTAKIETTSATVSVAAFGAKADGTDDIGPLQDAVDAVSAMGGGAVSFPVGARYAISETLNVPSWVVLRAGGGGSELIPDAVGGGTVIEPLGTFDFGVLVALTGSGARIEGVQVDGHDVVSTGVTMEGFQHRLLGCEIRRNLAHNVHVKPNLNGHENNIIDCFLSQTSRGVNVLYEGTSSIPCNDNLIANTVMRGGLQQVKTIWSGANQFVGCHFYAYPSATATHNVLAIDSSWPQFVGCYFDAPRNGVPLEIRSNDAPVYQPLVTGCSFLNFASSMPDNTNPAIKLDGTIYSIRGSNISGNIFAGYGPTRRFSFAVKALGFGRNGHIFANNSLYFCGSVFDPYPAQQSGNTLDGLAVAGSMRLADPTYEAMSTDVIDDLYRRWRMRANGTHEWGSGAAVSDVTLGRVAANVLGLGADDAFKTGTFTTAGRPSASTYGEGACAWDSTAKRSMESDGTNWRVASVEGAATRTAELHPAGALAHTFSRAGAKVEGAALLVSGREHLMAIRLRAGQTINSITFVSNTTAMAGGANQWFTLRDSNRALLGITSNDGATAWAATTAKTLALSAAYTVPVDGDYYVGIMVAATTVPNLGCVVGSMSVMGVPPIVSGYDATNTGLTAPSSAPATSAALTPLGTMPYAYVA